MAELNMFEWATKNKVRFKTEKGLQTVEDVWALPLTSRTGISLDSLAKDLNRQIKETEEESFVTESSSTSKELQRKFEIVKHIISVRKDELKAREERQANKDRDENIRRILAEKDHEELRNKTPEELRAMLTASGKAE